MVNVRIQHGSRLNVLLTQDRPYSGEHWTAQLPRLLEPQGVASYVACSVQEAIEVAERMPIHAAVIDLGMPMGASARPAAGTSGGSGASGAPGATAGATERRAAPTGRAPNPGRTTAGASSGPSGLWLLELFRRLPNRPPVVVLHGAVFDRREIERILSEALRLGAFSVLAKPVEIEQVLAVFRRLLDRQYQGAWPRTPGTPGNSGTPGTPGTPDKPGFPGGSLS